jgi:hypothetical protein
MVRFNCFLCSLFMGLFFYLPQSNFGNRVILENQVEITFSSGEILKNLLVFDSGIESNQTPFSFKTSKLDFVRFFYNTKQSVSETHDHKLLYFVIGSTIDLYLTTTNIIFPFHCFT